LSGRVDYGVAGLAVLLHDPPWKPWGIGVAGRIAGCGGSYWECIAGRLANDERLRPEARSAARQAAAEYRAYAESLGSHELQGALVLRVLAAELRARGLGEAARCAEEAERLILQRHPVVRRADTAASALDRLLLGALGDEVRSGGSLFIVNPFNPRIRRPIPDEIPVERVASFIAEYVRSVADVLEASSGAAGPGGACRTLLHMAFSLLEPAWYATVGPEYVPPADTRIPTHTVFDHVNAALATMLWAGGEGEGLRGCLAVVDLAGVQEWIQESRRLRDLWAASWLASLLAWKSVESLVEEYGPGVLVQPPARLNPFYAAWLISRLNVSNDRVRSMLMELLSLGHGFPVDPTLPTRITLALPPEACDSVEDRVRRGYGGAWREIMDRVAGFLDMECGGGSGGVACNALNEVRRLPPPLAQRIVVVGVEEAWREAERIYDENSRLLSGYIDRSRFAEAAYYPVALGIIAARREGERYIALPQRFATREYHEYARSVYGEALRRGREGRLLCTVCGRAAAVVDGEYLDREGVLAAEVGRERLCPYCLAKRLLRRLLETGVYQPFPGLNAGRAVRERLRPGSVDVYTARTRLAGDRLREALEAVAECYARNREDFREELRGRETLWGAFHAPNTFLTASERAGFSLEGEEIEKLESVVLEAAHYDRARGELVELLRSLEGCEGAAERVERALRTAWRVRRKYAILKLDGDFIGSMLIKAKLRLEPQSYVEQASNIGDNTARRRLAETVAAVIEALDRATHGSFREVSTLATPSYHFTLSRALAAGALKDRDLVERRGGFLVYAGGDDVLAILPPAERREFGGLVLARPTAMEAAEELRRAYWASDSPEGFKGFHLVRGSSGNVLAVVPALAVYGRSGSLLYVDSMYPMWASMRLSTLLEESKDEAELRRRGVNTAIAEKDVLFVAADSGGVAVLPQYLRGSSPHGVGDLDLAGRLVRAASAVALLGGRALQGETPLPGSLAADVQESVRRLWLAEGLARLLALRLLERSLGEGRSSTVSTVLSQAYPGVAGQAGITPGGRLDAARLLRALTLLAGLQEEDELFNLYALAGGEAGRLALASGYAVEARGRAAQQLFTSIIAALKAFRSAL